MDDTGVPLKKPAKGNAVAFGFLGAPVCMEAAFCFWGAMRCGCSTSLSSPHNCLTDQIHFKTDLPVRKSPTLTPTHTASSSLLPCALSQVCPSLVPRKAVAQASTPRRSSALHRLKMSAPAATGCGRWPGAGKHTTTLGLLPGSERGRWRAIKKADQQLYGLCCAGTTIMIVARKKIADDAMCNAEAWLPPPPSTALLADPYCLYDVAKHAENPSTAPVSLLEEALSYDLAQAAATEVVWREDKAQQGVVRTGTA